jgi:hypothetical protein
MMGYSNDVNPFGDANLGSKFVWKAKLDKLKADGVDPAAHQRALEQRRREQLADEVRAVKLRRDERHDERELWEREQRRLQLEREMGTLEEWQAHEEKFHLAQARKRTELRLASGRAKPVDLLAKRLAAAAATTTTTTTANDAVAAAEFDSREPQLLVEALPLDALAELRGDIETQIGIASGNDDHLRYWRALLIVVDDLIGQAGSSRDRSAVHAAVHGDVASILAGKTTEELLELRDDIDEKLSAPDEGTDVGYWEHLRGRLRVQLARSTLSDIHATHLEAQLARLERLDGEAAASAATATTAVAATSAATSAADQRVAVPATATSNQPVAASARAAGAVAATAGALASSMPPPAEVVPGAEDRLVRVAAAEMGAEEDGDALFNGTVDLAPTTYSWTSKYRPRKPRFFNRVHSGFVWNSFNRTHYDHDNPPPKIVQGYKFNIFYPDLVDKTKTPTYRILPSDSPETVLLVFHAGPPYEDIAFRIVNGEWATGKRSGFKCRFQNGVLSLYFVFQTVRYRK